MQALPLQIESTRFGPLFEAHDTQLAVPRSYAEGGTHQVTNGLALWKIHHAAYGSDIVCATRRYGAGATRRVGGDPRADAATRTAGGARLSLPRGGGAAALSGGLERRWERFRAAR